MELAETWNYFSDSTTCASTCTLTAAERLVTAKQRVTLLVHAFVILDCLAS